MKKHDFVNPVQRPILAPGPGSNLVYSPATGEIFRNWSLGFKLTTINTAGMRCPVLQVLDQAGYESSIVAPSPYFQGPGKSGFWSFGPGVNSYNEVGNVYVQVGMPSMPLHAGLKLLVTIVGIQATDAIEQLRLLGDLEYHEEPQLENQSLTSKQPAFARREVEEFELPFAPHAHALPGVTLQVIWPLPRTLPDNWSYEFSWNGGAWEVWADLPGANNYDIEAFPGRNGQRVRFRIRAVDAGFLPIGPYAYSNEVILFT